MSTDDIEFDRSLLGVEHSIGTFEVTKELIDSYAQATGETAPRYTGDDAIASPALCTMFTSGMKLPDIKLEFGSMGLFAGEAIDYLSPVKAGDTLEGRTKLKEVYAKTGRSGKMVFTVWETSFSRPDGETVALVRESYVQRGPKSNG